MDRCRHWHGAAQHAAQLVLQRSNVVGHALFGLVVHATTAVDALQQHVELGELPSRETDCAINENSA